MPSRQERRKQERDAAKRAAAAAGSAGAGGSAAAPANLNVNPVGDWTTQTESPSAMYRTLGGEVVARRAAAGDREAQYSQGSLFISAAGVNADALGAGGTTPRMDVGFSYFASQVSGRSQETRSSREHDTE